MNSRWASLLLGLLLLASLTACSDSQETARNEDGAWDDYVSWCSQASLEEPPGDEDQTYGEVSTFYAGVAARMRSTTPPVEVADWHNKNLDAIEAMKALIDAEPQDEIFNPIDIFFDSEIVSLFEEVGEALDDMPEDARERLAAAGCLDDDDSEANGEGLSVTPQPDSTATADSGQTSTSPASIPECGPRSSYEPALVALYNATDGPNWEDNTNWLTDALLSDWAGVSAHTITVNGRVTGECVTQLWFGGFRGNGLKGEIPAELGSILSLAVLDFSDEQLSGEIPAELGGLPNLQRMDLENNQLSGEIPAELGSLPTLQRLDLSDNQLSGEIPAELGNIPTLEWLDLSDNQLSGEIPAELGNIPTLYLDGNRLTGRVIRPGGTNPLYAWEGSTIRVNWDAVDGADYYNVYYDASADSSCDLDSDGSLSFCEELATDVTGTTYVHTNPSLSENYYWVVGCNGDGCSDIDSRHPAAPVEAIPTSPANARYALEGSTIRVSWEPVPGADYYNIYHDGSSDSYCSLDSDGSTGFCEELARNVEGTSFVHTAPDRRDNYYWIVACNRGGCSEIDSGNPATPGEAIPIAPANARYVVEGSTIRVSWSPVPGADYYNIYHHGSSHSSCEKDRDGLPGFCQELARNIEGTSFVHTAPNSRDNYYWIEACNRGGCSEIDSENPVRAPGTGSTQTTDLPGATRAPTQTPEPSTTPTPEPAPTQTPEPSTTPTPEPAPTQTPEPSTTPTPEPTPTQSPTPSTPPAGTIPSAPANVRFAHEGSTIRITWDPVAGADHYNIYHDDSYDSRCRLNRDGSAGFCEELARNVVGTTYVHTDPNGGENYYWVVACNSGGCSEIDSKNPAAPAEAIPTAPANARYAVEGSTIRISWDPVAGADHYNIYHDDFFDSTCRLYRDGSPGFCEELARNVVGTAYVHTDPGSSNNYYWIVACSRGGCSEIDAENPLKAPGTSSTESTSMPPASQELEFTEGESATRSIPENTPAGINVGAPVSAEGDGTLTYTLGGPDAASFTILPATGQVRTRDGVVYDYETRNRYTVTVGADDESGEGDTIEVTIHIEDLVAACQPVRNLRTNHGDEYVTAKWTPALQREGKASVLGYQVEMRRGDDGPWTGRRTLLGPGIGATIYGGLQNLQKYFFRIRPVNTESDCGWSPPFLGIPTTDPRPGYPTDRFGTEPVGAPDHHWRFVTPWRFMNQNRCRFSADGITLDANCTYTNTGPDTSKIVLEFDDPSRGSCDIALAFSSLTAGSFVDDCFDAGVNTETPFDTSFTMPHSGPQNESGADIPRAPRSQEEFDVLAWGRDDFIPGLVFGCTEHFVTCEVKLGEALQIERHPDMSLKKLTKGKYTYENTGSSRGVLTFQTEDGESYVFTLDFEPSGNMRVTIADEEGESATWPGIFHSDPALDLQLPVPPSWWAAAAIETDFAPEESAIDSARESFVWHSLVIPLLDRAVACPPTIRNCIGTQFSQDYLSLGRNRAILTVSFPAIDPKVFDRLEEPLRTLRKTLNGSTYAFDITYTADGAARYTLFITKEGHVPVVKQGFVDFNGNSINLNEFPEEIRLPLAPPQATGQDRSGVAVAAALSAPEIGGNDLQIFLIGDEGEQPASYQPGDWLEPKDGSNQRMLIVGVSQGTSAAPTTARQPVQAMTLRYYPAFPSLEVSEPAVFHGMPSFRLMRFAPLTTSVFYSPLVVSASYALDSEPTITQLQVVCMQQDSETYRIPTRGDRYFSVPKAAEGPVQLCQRDCALNETTNVQQCVWDCEERQMLPDGRTRLHN